VCAPVCMWLEMVEYCRRYVCAMPCVRACVCPVPGEDVVLSTTAMTTSCCPGPPPPASTSLSHIASAVVDVIVDDQQQPLRHATLTGDDAADAVDTDIGPPDTLTDYQPDSRRYNYATSSS